MALDGADGVPTKVESHARGKFAGIARSRGATLASGGKSGPGIAAQDVSLNLRPRGSGRVHASSEPLCNGPKAFEPRARATWRACNDAETRPRLFPVCSPSNSRREAV